MPRGKKILAATAGVAAVTGLAVAVRRKGRSEEPGEDAVAAPGTETVPEVRHVVPFGDEWAVEVEGAPAPESRHATKREAVETARRAAHDAAPSRLVIHRVDGTIQRQHAYEPG